MTMDKPIDISKLNHALQLLNEQLVLNNSPQTEIVVCGGSALIALSLVPRTTQDVDIVALMKDGVLSDSDPLPEYLLKAAENVGRIMNLPEGWLNAGPASQLQMGLPDGFEERLHPVNIGEKLVVHYIDRIDQIYFKTFASADRGGYHVTDLKLLSPSEDELIAAAKWCQTQDVSPEFTMILKDLFNRLGWPNVSARI